MKRSFPGFKTFTIGVLCFIVAVAAVSRTLGSGGNECEDLDCHSFFSPDVIQSPGERPFFLGDRTFYFARTDPKEDVQAVNLEEWAKYYGPAIPKPQLSILVYKLSPEAVADVVESLGGKNVVLRPASRRKVAQNTDSSILPQARITRRRNMGKPIICSHWYSINSCR